MHETPLKAFLGFIVAFIMANIAGSTEAKHLHYHTNLNQRYVDTSLQPSNVERVGLAVNVPQRFGDLSLIIRTAPRNDTEQWLFRIEPHYVMKNITVIRRHLSGQPFKFNVMLCSNINCLLRSYFHRFRICGVNESWKAFSAAWTNHKKRKTLGISEEALYNGKYAYAILKLEMLRDSYKLKRQEQAADQVQNSFDNITVNNANSILNFHTNVGTHFIESFTTGELLFQVLAIDKEKWMQIRNDHSITSHLPITKIDDFLKPTFVQSVGKIMAASGDLNLSEWANNALPAVNDDSATVPTLFSLVRSRTKLKELFKKSTANAIVQLQLNLLEKTVVSSEEKKQWYKEVTHNLLSLMENNV